MGRFYEEPPPGSRNGRCYAARAAASNLRRACHAAVRPSQSATLDISTPLGRPVVNPLRTSSRFGKRNLLMSESGTSTRVWPSLLSSHEPQLDCPRPPSRRGVSPSPSSTGTSRFTLPLLLLTPPTLRPPCPCNLPCDPSARWIPHSFPCRALSHSHFFLPVTSLYQSPREACFPDIPWLHRHHRSAPRQPGRGHRSPYRYGAHGGAWWAASLSIHPT